MIPHHDNELQFRSKSKFSWDLLRFYWHRKVQKVQIYCFDLLAGPLVAMKKTNNSNGKHKSI